MIFRYIGKHRNIRMKFMHGFKLKAGHFNNRDFVAAERRDLGKRPADISAQGDAVFFTEHKRRHFCYSSFSVSTGNRKNFAFI